MCALRLEHLAGLVEAQAGVAVEQLAVVAIAQVDQEVGLPAAVGEELGVHLGDVEATHGATVQAQRPRRNDEVRATQGAVARGGGAGQGGVGFEVLLGAFAVPHAGHVLVELRVGGHDHRHRRGAGLVQVAGRHGRQQALARFLRLQKHVARGLGVHRGGAERGQFVHLLEQVHGHGLVEETIGRAGLAKDRVDGNGVERGHGGKSFRY